MASIPNRIQINVNNSTGSYYTDLLHHIAIVGLSGLDVSFATHLQGADFVAVYLLALTQRLKTTLSSALPGQRSVNEFGQQ